jgi:SAM-dependent methyltransferase
MKKYENTIMSIPCRFCKTLLEDIFLDLGQMPLVDNFLESESDISSEKLYPLKAMVCPECFLVQVADVVPPEDMFSTYHYFSSYSESWLKHCKSYAEMIIDRLKLDLSSTVIEMASNDGYMLKYFKENGISVLGVEPASNIAQHAIKQGIPTENSFFGKVTAQRLRNRGHQADLMIGNNVMAHVPDVNDFVAGIKILLKPTGIVTMEFPHLGKFMEENQFDTIFHEHASYLSLIFIKRLFEAQRLQLFHVEQIPTHGGSLRIYARHVEAIEPIVESSVQNLLDQERAAGLNNLLTYTDFPQKVARIRDEMLEFLRKVKSDGKTIAGYGAPGKGIIFLNYCGITPDLLSYTVDRNDHKQGLLLPGTHQYIHNPDFILNDKPDYVLILPWNLRVEIAHQMNEIRKWGGQFVVGIPELNIF